MLNNVRTEVQKQQIQEMEKKKEYNMNSQKYDQQLKGFNNIHRVKGSLNICELLQQLQNSFTQVGKQILKYVTCIVLKSTLDTNFLVFSESFPSCSLLFWCLSANFVYKRPIVRSCFTQFQYPKMAQQVPAVNPEEQPQPTSPQKPPQQSTQQPTTPQKPFDSLVLDQKCICELCTCGRHHCPQPRVKGIFQTSYKNHYKQYRQQGHTLPAGSLPTGRQYVYEMLHYKPEQLKSNYQDNYVEKKLPTAPAVGQSQLVHLVESSPRTRIPFSDQTEYKKNYPGYPVEKMEKIANNASRFEKIGKTMVLSSPVKFTGTTSYTDHYKGYSLERPIQRQQSQEINTEIFRSPVKFEGVSNYKSSYVPPPKVEAKGGPLAMGYHQYPSLPFQGESTYKNQFAGYRYDPAQPRPSVLNPYVRASPIKFEGVTSYQQYYDAKKIPRPEEPRRQHKCICEVINVPTVNYHDKPHLRFDAAHNQWV